MKERVKEPDTETAWCVTLFTCVTLHVSPERHTHRDRTQGSDSQGLGAGEGEWVQSRSWMTTVFCGDGCT